jgi:hypothetical protein
MNKDALKQPFFATLLESQNRIPAPEGQYTPITPTTWTPPGKDPVTHKYPSDGDDEWPPL